MFYEGLHAKQEDIRAWLDERAAAGDPEDDEANDTNSNVLRADLHAHTALDHTNGGGYKYKDAYRMPTPNNTTSPELYNNLYWGARHLISLTSLLRVFTKLNTVSVTAHP
ncbi:hypothetical protein C8R44DRAFT_975036 [Mycena epipterygia]|nr:hypothetical protein C8R44DRAFT_975036 [Mycena epipterygia]